MDREGYDVANPGTPGEPGVPATPGLRDVARFLGAVPKASVEPGAFTLAGANTNFIAAAGERERSGELLGQPVTVRFSPVSYVWSYGDGGSQTTSAPGSTWAASGLGEFAKTPTSHVYESRGSYEATVDIAFSAQFRFAGRPWVTIPGTLGLTSEPIVVTVKGVKAVLVGHSCDEKPSGPGC